MDVLLDSRCQQCFKPTQNGANTAHKFHNISSPGQNFASQIPRRLFATAFIVCLIGVFGRCAARGQAQSREYELKAVFLFNLVQFTEWPASAFADTNSPLVIGILGANPFGRTLEETVSGEKVNGRSIVIQRCDDAKDAGNCHIVFICRSESARLEKILRELKDRNVLTVGETEGFAQKGGLIGLGIEKNKLRFSINVEAVRASGVSVSSKLLRLAEIVTAKKT